MSLESASRLHLSDVYYRVYAQLFLRIQKFYSLDYCDLLILGFGAVDTAIFV